MSEAKRIVLQGGRLITMAAAGILEDGYLIIAGNRIVELGRGNDYTSQADDEVIKIGERFILPGLIDAHTHLSSATAPLISEELVARGTIRSVIAAASAIRAGITAVRDLGCKHAGIYMLQQAIESGQLVGPRVWTAGRNLSGTGVVEAWRNFAYDGVDQFRRAVRKEWQAGAHWIKLILSDGQWGEQDVPLLTLEEARAAVSEAHDKYLRVSAHVDGPRGMELALAAGCDSIEHGVDFGAAEAARMAEAGMTYVPTAWCYANEVLPAWRTDGEIKRRAHRLSFERALAANVRLAAGTDADYSRRSPGEALSAELKTMVEWGMNPIQALRTVTVNAAELLGVETHLGSLQPDKRADIVVLAEDPTRDPAAISALELVFQEGRKVYDRKHSSQPAACPLAPLQPQPWGVSQAR